MNQAYGAFGAKVPAYQIMGSGGSVSGPAGTGLSDNGKAYTDANGEGYTQIPAFNMPRMEIGRFPRLPGRGETQPSDPTPIYDYPPNGGGGQMDSGGRRVPNVAALAARFNPRFKNEVNVYVNGGTVSETPAAEPAVVADVGTSTPIEVYDDASASTEEKPLQYVWAVGYVPAWQAAELNADPVKLEKAQAVVKHGRKRKLLMGVGAVILGFLVARAARKAA